MDTLNQNQFLHLWDRVWLLNMFCRSYCCTVCFLEGLDQNVRARTYPKTSQCRRHSVYNKQHLCTAHSKAWTKCSDCRFDVRAGTSFCKYCFIRYSSIKCVCPRDFETTLSRIKAFNTEQPEEQKALKAALVQSSLRYASELQAAYGNETEIERIKAEFRHADTSGLRTIFQLG
jgi:hypothetical protein